MSLGQRSRSQSVLKVCALASVKPVCVRLITLLSRMPQTWCDIGIWFSIRSYVHPSTFATTLAWTLLFRFVTLKSFEILWHHLAYKVKVTAGSLILLIPELCPIHNFTWNLVRFENYLAQMIITTKQCVTCKNHVARSEVKVTVHTYSLYIGILYSAHYFIIHGGI